MALNPPAPTIAENVREHLLRISVSICVGTVTFFLSQQSLRVRSLKCQ